MKAANSLRAWCAVALWLFSVPLYAQKWSLTSAPTNRWRAVTCSADSRIIAAAGDQGLFTSTNYGQSWLSNQDSAAYTWVAMASSADGTHLAAVRQDSAVYVSTNTGAIWQSNSLSAGGYGCLACSADGSVLAVVAYGGNAVYFSTNSGATWFSTSPPASGLVCVAISADGRRVLAANDNLLVVSTNSGGAWAIQGPLPALGVAVRTMAGSADCTRLMLAAYADLDTSADAGATWAATPIAVTPQWLGVAASADGLGLAAANYFGQIYTSTNAGLTWTSNNVPAASWMAVASAADGKRLLAAALSGGIWSSYLPATPKLDIAVANNYTKLSWLVASADFVLEQNQDLNTTNWTTLGTTAYLNTTNLHYEVLVPTSAGNAFYRLRAR